MTTRIAHMARRFDKDVLSAFVPWHVHTWRRSGRA
jgi:hypothetical protein